MSSSLEELRRAFVGLSTGERDIWVNETWNCAEVPADQQLPVGSVPYLPCPTASVEEAVVRSGLGPHDVFIDVGSGLGRTVFIAHLMSGAQCRGIEIQDHLVDGSRSRGRALGLRGISFVRGDAALSLDEVSHGNVFFLYCPFGARQLDLMLSSLRDVADVRPVRLCTVGIPPIRRPWLTPRPASPHVSVYESQLAHAE